MKNILVPFDFSDASYNALSYAAFLANAFTAKLTLVHAYAGDSKVYNESGNAELADENFLKKEIKGIIRNFTVKISSIVKKGNAVKIINEAAEEVNAELIIMGMKGKGESTSKFGSTTTKLIAKTSIPLLVVPKGATYQTIATITLASDFNDEKLLTHFGILDELMKTFDPFIQILNVQKTGSKLTAKSIADKMGADLMWDKYNHSFNIIEIDDVEEGINKFLKKRSTDLLIMVARKKNLLSKIFAPSHTKKMTHQTKIPLLVLHENHDKMITENIVM